MLHLLEKHKLSAALLTGLLLWGCQVLPQSGIGQGPSSGISKPGEPAFSVLNDQPVEGTTTTYAGFVGPGYQYEPVDGERLSATFHKPLGASFDSAGNLFIAGGLQNCIRKITPQGQVITIAGSKTREAGYRDGPAATALFQHPSDVVADAQGNVYVSESMDGRIRKISADGIVSTLNRNV